MFYPDIPFDEWLRRYPNLEYAVLEWPIEHEDDCSGIGVPRPYATHDFVGLNYKCPCNASIVVPRTPESDARWRKIFGV